MSVSNNKSPVLASLALTFEEELALVKQLSEEAAQTCAAATNTSQTKALEAAAAASLRQKEVLKNSASSSSSSSSSNTEDKELEAALKASLADCPKPTSKSAATASASAPSEEDDLEAALKASLCDAAKPSASSSSSSASGAVDDELEAAIKASLGEVVQSKEAAPLLPTTNETWISHPLSSGDRFALKLARPALTLAFRSRMTDEAKKLLNEVDVNSLKNLGDVEKVIIPLVEASEKDPTERLTTHRQVKNTLKLTAEKGVGHVITKAMGL